LPAFVFTSAAKAAAFYAYLPVGGYVQFHSSPTAVQVYVGFSGCYVRVAQVDGSTAEIGAYVRSLEKLVEYDVAYGTQGVVGVEESVVRLALLFLLLSILLFIIRCTILARRCTVLWCVQFLLW